MQIIEGEKHLLRRARCQLCPIPSQAHPVKPTPLHLC